MYGYNLLKEDIFSKNQQSHDIRQQTNYIISFTLNVNAVKCSTNSKRMINVTY